MRGDAVPPKMRSPSVLVLLVCLVTHSIPHSVSGHDEEPLVQAFRRLQQVQQQQPLNATQNATGDFSHDITWNSLFHHQPMHHHHNGYKFMLTRQQRQRGISHYGSAERMRAALSRAITNKKLTVSVLGASISAGIGAEDAPAWVDRLEQYLKDTYTKVAGVNVTVNNGAVPGTTSAYMAACVNLHIPRDTDIVIIEYSVNDEWQAYPTMDNPIRRPYERLLRKVLSLPNNPAVILLHAYAWFKPDPHLGNFYNNAEQDLNELAEYYGLSAVSVKSCCYEAMRNAEPGFQVHAPRDRNKLDYKGLVFYWDTIHPDGITGHRVMAELVITLLQRGVADILHSPLTQAEKEYCAAPLPPPMVKGNYQSVSSKCYVGEVFKTDAVVGKPASWEWINESKTVRPKWGFVAKTPGALLKIKVNTVASTGTANSSVLVQLGYLKSYEHMGKAIVKCDSGCTCGESIINGHTTARSSLLNLHGIYVSQKPECVMSIQVVEDTDAPSGEHKVKLAAVIVQEEAGEVVGISNAAAVEHVHDISFRNEGFGAGKGVFDIRNHI